MWELDHKESWALKIWCFWTVVLKTLESPLDYKEIKLVNSKGNQSWRVLLLLSHFSCVRLCATPWMAACQASLSITNSWSLPKLTSIELVMPSNLLIPCHPLLLLPSIFPRIRVFSNESVLHIRWSKCWRFCFSICHSNEYSGLTSFMIDWLDLLAVQGTLKSFLNTTVPEHQFFGAQLYSQSNSRIHTWPLEKP